MDNKSINIVCYYASEYAGNFIPSILHLSESIKSKKRIIFTFPKEAENRYWIKHIREKGYDVFFISNFSNKHVFKKELREINKDNNVNIVYTHFVSGLKAKSVYPFSHKIKLVIHVHSDFTGSRSHSFKRKLLRFLEFNLIRRDAKYIFVSKYLCPKVNKRFFAINNAVCVDRIVDKALDIKDFKVQNYISDNDTTFLIFGWSPFIKGVDIAVKAYLDLPAELKNKAKLIIVHGRNDGYERCINFLKTKLQSDEFLNEKSIVFVKPLEDVFSLYSMTDVFVSASRSEGFSYSVIEALYFGNQCLVSDIKGTIWSKDYDNVSVFHSENSDELSKLMAECLSEKKKKILNTKIIDDFSIEEWSKKIGQILFE